MNRRSLFQAITGAIVASAMELGFVGREIRLPRTATAGRVVASELNAFFAAQAKKIAESPGWKLQPSPWHSLIREQIEPHE